MDILDIVLTIGIPSIIIALIYIGRKLQVLDSVEKIVESMRDRFSVVEDRVDTLWKDRLAPASSPRRLNKNGEEILKESGIQGIVDQKFDILRRLIHERSPKNPYDADTVIYEVMSELPKHCPDILNDLKDGAFKVGADIDGVLFVGSIYLRDRIFPDLGFSISDLDKPNV